jgi:predicted permease
LIDLTNLFVNNLLPILLIAAVGYLLGMWLQIDPRSLSRVIFYILSPCLVFNLIINSQLSNGDIFRMAGFAVVQTLTIGFIAWILGKVVKLERRLLAALLLVTMSLNAGNYGLSLTQFAFGQTALAHASLFFVTTVVLTYTVGVTIASMGSTNILQSLLKLIKIPTIYSVILAYLFISLGWELPLPVERSVSLPSDATIPLMIILLGLQLQHSKKTNHLKALGLATGVRMLLAPVIALGLAALFGLQGAARQAGIIEASMPAAVVSTVIATEFDAEPAFVTTVVFTTTIISPLTLTPLLYYLGA